MERVMLVFDDVPNINDVIQCDDNVRGYTKDGYVVVDMIRKCGKIFLYLEILE